MKRLLLYMKDGLGDYIFRRHIFPAIKNSPKYKGWHITATANRSVCGFIRKYDRQYIDETFLCNAKPHKFKDRFLTFIPKYKARYARWVFTKEHMHYDTILCFTERLESHDKLIERMTADCKIASEGYSFVSEEDYAERYTEKSKQFYDKHLYTKLIKDIPDVFFPFTSTHFANEVLGENLPTPPKTKLPFSAQEYEDTKKYLKEKYGVEKFICIIPFANSRYREWDIKNFAKVINDISQNTSLPFLVLGWTQAKEKSEIFNCKNCINLVGKTSLREAALIAAVSSFAVSVDTGLMHVALLGGSNTVTISNGVTHRWSVEYTKEENVKQKIFYPPQFDPKGKQFMSKLDINAIKPEDVIAYINNNWQI